MANHKKEKFLELLLKNKEIWDLRVRSEAICFRLKFTVCES